MAHPPAFPFMNRHSQNAIKFAASLALFMGAASAWGQNAGGTPPQNVLQLSASGSSEVAQDQLSITLGTTRDGTDGSAVQAQLKSVLETALAEARKGAQPGQLEVRTGNFSLMPRYARDGKINGWQGTAELVLEGRDFVRLTQVAGRLPGLAVTQVNFGLSRELRAKAESEAQLQAIGAFKAKADELARGFGFAGYTLREVAVNASQGGLPRPRVMAAEAKSFSADAPLPVEAGKAVVTVQVSGSVQLK